MTGAVPEVDDFAHEWQPATGHPARPRMAQRIYCATRVRAPEDVPGTARPASEADRGLLVSWVEDFVNEARLRPSGAKDHVERIVDARLAGPEGGFVLWEHGEPVSLAGWGGRPPSGVRIGPVYMPPEHRGQGFGSAVTAAVTSERLAGGFDFCCLYTDVANPTSNRIYSNLGYDAVCDSTEYVFEP